MTDWNNPSTSQTHSNELASTKGRDESNAIMDYSADSNIPDGTIRWNATANRFEKWDVTGGAWSQLTATYSITVTNANDANTLDGNDSGNASGNIPVSNGSLNSNLNSDLLDGQHGAYYDDAPNGTKMLFYQASAPTGWTQDTSINDRVLRVVSGSGGGSGGQWTITGLGKGSLSVDGHALTEAEMPSHDHPASASTNAHTGTHTYAGGSGTSGADEQASVSVTVGNAGSDNPHDHGLSGSPNHTPGWRPSYVDVIAATRSK